MTPKQRERLLRSAFGRRPPGGVGADLYQGVDRLTGTWLEMGRKIVPDRKHSQIYQSTYARYLEARAELVVSDFL